MNDDTRPDDVTLVRALAVATEAMGQARRLKVPLTMDQLVMVSTILDFCNGEITSRIVESPGGQGKAGLLAQVKERPDLDTAVISLIRDLDLSLWPGH